MRPGLRRPRSVSSAVVLAAVGVVLAVPIVAVALQAIRPGGSFGLESVERILGSARTWRLVAVTVVQAAASCALTLVIGLPMCWVLSRLRFPGRSLLRATATVPFVLPSVVIGTAFASLLGPRGVVDLRGSWWPILAAHLCFNLAVVLRTVGAALDGVSPEIEASGRVLGAGARSVALRITLPMIAPAIGAAAAIVFLFCLTSFGVVVILGGGSVSTIEVEIWTRATRQFDLSGAGVLALVQLAAVLAALSVHARLTRRAVAAAPSGRPRLRPPRTLGERGAVAATILAVLVVSLVPLAALLERSLRVGDHLGLDHWRGLGSAVAGTGLAVAPIDAVVTSLLTAAVATVLAVGVGLPAARAVAGRPGGFGDRLLLVPLGVSATTIGLGLLLAVGRPPVDLRRSWWIVPVAQAFVAMPLVVRVVLPALRSLPSSLDEAGATLGARRAFRWWRIELPLSRRAVVAGGGLALVACLGEFGATVFVARSDRPTVPVAIERLMSRPGGAGFGQAMALSCVLALLCAAVVAAVDRWAGGDEGVGPGF